MILVCSMANMVINAMVLVWSKYLKSSRRGTNFLLKRQHLTEYTGCEIDQLRTHSPLVLLPSVRTEKFRVECIFYTKSMISKDLLSGEELQTHSSL